MVPALTAPQDGGQRLARIRRIAYELHLLELEYERVVLVCSVADWPWIRQAFADRADYAQHERSITLPVCRPVAADCLYFTLGELPHITHQYEHRRAEMVADETLSIDGIKALLIDARDRWQSRVSEVHRPPYGAAADGTVAQIRAELNAYGKSAYARPV